MADKSYQIEFAGEAVDEDFYADVVSLKIEENTSMASTMQLTLSTRQDDKGAWDYLEDTRLAPFTKVGVKVGFSGGGGLAGALGAAAGALTGGGSGDDGLEHIFDGYITGMNLNLGSSPGNSHIEVEAMDTGVLMSLEEKVATWKDLSDADIVQQIVSAYGVRVQTDSTPTVHQENDTVIIQRGSDIQFVRDRAALNGMEFYFETDKEGAITAYFRKPQLDGTPQPDLAIQFGEDSNLRSFSARLNAQRPLSAKVQQIDVKANSPNLAQAGDVQLAKLGDKDANTVVGAPLSSLLTPKDVVGQMLVLGPPTSDATELQTIAQTVRDEAGWFISAQGEINSDAYQAVLRPHRLVLVKGSGTPFSGKYYVTRVVHELKGDGSYSQSFEARRNARDLDGTESFGEGGGLGLPVPGL